MEEDRSRFLLSSSASPSLCLLHPFPLLFCSSSIFRKSAFRQATFPPPPPSLISHSVVLRNKRDERRERKKGEENVSLRNIRFAFFIFLFPFSFSIFLHSTHTLFFFFLFPFFPGKSTFPHTFLLTFSPTLYFSSFFSFSRRADCSKVDSPHVEPEHNGLTQFGRVRTL